MYNDYFRRIIDISTGRTGDARGIRAIDSGLTHN